MEKADRTTLGIQKGGGIAGCETERPPFAKRYSTCDKSEFRKGA